MNIVAQENQCRSVYPLKEKPTSARLMLGTSPPSAALKTNKNLANVCESATVCRSGTGWPRGGYETFGAIDCRFCASRWDSGRVWSRRGTAAATRARLCPARVVQRLFAWHGLTDRRAEAAWCRRHRPRLRGVANTRRPVCCQLQSWQGSTDYPDRSLAWR